MKQSDGSVKDLEPNLLGSGLQYRAFSISGELVVKIPQTCAGCVRKYLSWEKSRGLVGIINAIMVCLKASKDRKFASRKFLMFGPKLLEHLGRPQFVGDKGIYVQQKVVPLGEINFTQTQLRMAVSSYVQIQRLLMEHDLIEGSMNISGAVGITPSGKFVLYDFGELVDKHVGLELLKQESWKQKSSYKLGLDDRYRKTIDAVIVDFLTEIEDGKR